MLKTILRIEEAERFANPKARAQHRLTDKRSTKKERKEMQNRAGESRIQLHADTTFKDNFSHISGAVFPTSKVFCPFKQFQDLRQA